MASPHNSGVEPEKAKRFRGLFGSSKSRQREAFASATFATSSIDSSYLVSCSLLHTRDRPLPMVFHREWQHPSCSVMKWYNQQKESSTRFRSIEHRRSMLRPFYHEFLLLKLTDGAVCRVERLGEGSPMDAVRLIGIRSHDVIRWYPKERQGEAEVNSEAIAEVDLGQEFDILDVLAICYTIQSTKPCRVYTLQRYNCYFLCLTILAVLARQAASWETALTPEAWKVSVERVLDPVSGLSREEAAQYPILRLCAMLDPDNSLPGDLVVNTLRSHLITAPNCLSACKRGVSDTLWHSSLARSISDNLRGEFDSVIKRIAEDESDCGKHIRDFLNMNTGDAATMILGNKQLLGDFETAGKKWIVPYVADTIKRWYTHERMRWVESPIPFYARSIGALLGPTSVPLAKFSFRLASTIDPNHEGVLSSRVYFNIPYMTMGKLMQFQWSLILAGRRAGDGFAQMCREISESSEFQIVASTAIMSSISSHAEVNRPDLMALCAFLETGPLKLSRLLNPFIISSLVDLSSAVGEQQRRVALRLSSQLDAPEIHDPDLTPTEFQNLYIKHRIDAHAKRVEDNHFAPALLVSEDIKKVMEMVWWKLPKPFSSTFSDNAESGPSDERG